MPNCKFVKYDHHYYRKKISANNLFNSCAISLFCDQFYVFEKSLIFYYVLLFFTVIFNHLLTIHSFLRYRVCFDQGLPRHPGNYRV